MEIWQAGIIGKGKEENSQKKWLLIFFSDFKHVYDFGNLTDVEDFGNDTFGTYNGFEFCKWSLEKISRGIFEPLASILLNHKNAKIFKNGQKIILVTSKVIYELGPDFLLTESKNPFESNALFRFEAGIYRREYFIVQDDSINKDFALVRMKLYQEFENNFRIFFS